MLNQSRVSTRTWIPRRIDRPGTWDLILEVLLMATDESVHALQDGWDPWGLLPPDRPPHRAVIQCVSTHRFPLSKPQLASQWVHSLGMKNLVPTANTCLCSQHFRPDCFRDYNGKQFLREDAVPTIFTSGQDSTKVGLPSLLERLPGVLLC